ncbi:MAG: bifunctional demethylmenaquinone methyltransferase/2-methoxy-6-polyprenyl-1,4-benzoquinol methylase UbiE [Planctomycetota bacterium]
MPPDPSPSSPDVVWSADDLRGDPHATDDKADRVRTMFGAIAHRYDLNNRLHSFGRDQAWRRRAVRLAEVGPGDDVLDVACGTGDLAEAFATAGPRSVVGLDFTPRMLDIARRKATRLAPGQRPEYVEGDAMALPFEDGRFDVVSIAFGIRNVDEPRRALAEFHRVLRPGGRLVILEFGRPRNRLLRVANDLYTRRVMPITAGLLAGDRSGAYRYLPRSISTFLDPGALAAACRTVGFGDLRSIPMTFGVCWASRGVRP